MKEEIIKPPPLGIDETIDMLKALLAGVEVKAFTPSEKEKKAALLRDIAFAEEHGYQIEIPFII